jgi:hypothetical protein
MTMRFHSTILATTLAATVAVGLAGVSVVTHIDNKPAAKADRLPVIADANGYLTIETRDSGVSVLKRVRVE